MGGLSTGAILVFAIIAVALVLFVTEVIPNDMTAVGVIVALAVLGPWTEMTPRDVISGFSSTATITIVAMYMLSAGIQKTGLVQLLGAYLGRFAGDSETKALSATIGSTGPIAGFINNTPVVAVFIPMITDLADRVNISPSRLLMPLSFAAILGGTLTLIGTSTNLLASELAAKLIEGRGAIGMFEFTPLGLIILFVGITYLMTVGRWLVPARIPPSQDLVEEFEVQEDMTRLRLREDSSLVGKQVDELLEQENVLEGVEVLQLVHGEETMQAPYTDRIMEPGDLLTVMGAREKINSFAGEHSLRQLPGRKMTEEQFEEEEGTVLAKFLVGPDSPYRGKSIIETNLETHHQSTVLAIRRDQELIKEDIDHVELDQGDTLLMQTTPEALPYFEESGELTLVHDSTSVEEEEVVPELDEKTPLTVSIMAAVILSAAFGAPIVIAALGGVLGMVVTGCLTTQDAYRSVSWNIIFLLAGVIPLGLAMQRTGGDQAIGSLIATFGEFLPAVGVLFVLYLLTGLLANIITPVATIVLMIPIAVDVAVSTGANEFSFLLGVMFASATSFMTPVGYQTNLMVYVPGGYKFSDFLLVGGPLQFLLAVVTTGGIYMFWGV